MNTPSRNSYRFLFAGDSALVIQFGETVDARINQHVRKISAIVKGEDIEGVVDLVPTMRSLMIHYDPLCISQAELKKFITPLLGREFTWMMISSGGEFLFVTRTSMRQILTTSVDLSKFLLQRLSNNILPWN